MSSPGHWTLCWGLLLVLLMAGGCEAPTTPDATCESVQGLDPLHADMLAFAGWLEPVTAAACEVEYTRRIELTPSQEAAWYPVHVFGRAFCTERRMLVRTHQTLGLRHNVPLPLTDVLTTLVHEAAHLTEDCRPDETFALSQERAFQRDLLDRLARCAEQDTCPEWAARLQP